MVQNGQSTDGSADGLIGADLARRALRSAPDDPITLANAALALTFFGEEIGAMMVLADRALALNPSYARGWYVSSMLRGWAVEHDGAIDQMNRSLRLNPRIRLGVAMYVLFGAAHLFSRQFDEAASNLRIALQETRTIQLPIASYPHATPTWGGSVRRARQSAASRRISSAILPLTQYSGDSPIGNCSCQACPRDRPGNCGACCCVKHCAATHGKG